MGSTELERRIRDRQRATARALGDECRRARLDAGLSLRALSRATSIDTSHLRRVELAERDPSLDAAVAIATALGHDLSIRLYPSSGPRIRDHIQARMIEALVTVLHARWLPRLEVSVYRPVRGVIDLVLQDRDAGDVVAGEGHSQLRSAEAQLRRAGEKADALPSAIGWPWMDAPELPRVSRLLLLRSTEALRSLVRALPATFASAYPAATEAAYAALTGPDRWPGAAILWVDVRGARTRVMQGPPRGVGR